MTQVRVGIGVFVKRSGKFLMGRRRNAHGEGSWSLPGGHLEFGESFADTARREVYEETGLSITDVRFAAVTNDRFEDEGRHYVTVWMLGDSADGVPTIREPEKFTDLDWFDFDTLPSPLFLPWQQLLASEFLHAIKAACRADVLPGAGQRPGGRQS